MPTAARHDRLEVPIERLRLPDGAVRFGVPIRIAGFPAMTALLDTGSTGLRVLGVPDASVHAPRGEDASYAYASGVRVSGATAMLAAGFPGGRMAPLQVHLIDRVGCVDARPACPAARVPFAAYRFGGNGAADVGYRAILGIRAPLAGRPWSNPLATLAERWIIEAPRAGEPDGRLVLNPSPADLSGFAWVPAADEARGAAGAVPGCVTLGDAGRACGNVVFDLGANGLRIPWAESLPEPDELRGATLTFRIADRSFATVAGQRPPLDRIVPLRGAPADAPILAGVLPYMFWDVLYDAHRPGLGLRERPVPPAGEP